MTKKLEELLDLPESKEIVDEEKAKEEEKADIKKVKIEDHESTKRNIAELDKLTSKLYMKRFEFTHTRICR